MDQLQDFDQRLNGFDEAWNKQSVPSIEEYLLTPEDARQRELLIELVMIDLEYRWRVAEGSTARGTWSTLSPSERSGVQTTTNSLPWFPLLRDYQRCFPLLGNNESLPLSLIVEEYRVRRKWGDQPSLEQYAVLYGADRADLPVALAKVDDELCVIHNRASDAAPPLLPTESPTAPGGQSTSCDLQIGDQIDDFRLLNKLGAGSFAEVFLAQQRSMHRLVALKVSSQVSYEPKLLSALDHPNIVRVYDQRHVNGLTLLYMQYVSGGNLREIVEQMKATAIEDRTGHSFLQSVQEVLEEKGEIPSLSQRSTPVEQMDWATTVAWIGARLADALQHAHENDVFHRDIKLENILVTAGGRPMLVDFNLSFGQSVQGEEARDIFGGSLSYMSPQQLEVILGSRAPQDIGAHSDFYSLAIVLWELLVGEHPFESDAEHTKTTVAQMIERRRTGPDFAKLPAECPSGLKKTLVECLSPENLDRFGPTPRIVRRLHLSLLPQVDQLLSPDSDSWAATWADRPTFWLVLYGVLHNAIISVLNIWANHRLTIHNFDQQFFKQTQEPVINAVAFSVGTLFAVWILLPVLQAVWRDRVESDANSRHSQIGYRSLSAPGSIALLILGLWISSGIAFPLWNQVSPNSQIGSADFLVFLSSQVLHGMIAASTTFVFISFVSVAALYPRFLPEKQDREGQRRLDRIDKQLTGCTLILGLTPLLAMLVLALTDRAETPVFVALALLGFMGHLITATLTPMIRTKLRALKLALAPMGELLNAATQSAARE